MIFTLKEFELKFNLVDTYIYCWQSKENIVVDMSYKKHCKKVEPAVIYIPFKYKKTLVKWSFLSAGNSECFIPKNNTRII